MASTELVKLARELNTVHGMLPVPVSGKVPIGGTGWNMLPLETRLAYITSTECTGIGIQCGLIFHTVLGPVELRAIDCDIDDWEKSRIFATTLLNYFPIYEWRLGRRAATLVFTQPGIIKREKFGPIQLLGNGKQLVYWGEYHNKNPLPNDPPVYRHVGPNIFKQMPPLVPAATLQTAIEAGVIAAGYPIYPERNLGDAVPLSADDFAMLTPGSFVQFQHDIKSMLFDVERSPIGSGRGTKLHHLGLKYGALIKASGAAQLLTDAARQLCPGYIEFETIEKHALLQEIGRIADEAFALLPGTLGHGDKRDFARGVGMSMGLAQNVEVIKAKTRLAPPSGRGHPGQPVEDLMREILPPLRFVVGRFFVDCGCFILAGKPKVGKGFIILELALSIAEGGKFWGQQCEQGEVLMYMLEDGKRRIKNRIEMLRPGKETRNIKFRYSVDGPFYVNADGTGTLLDDIGAHLKAFPLIRTVMIDVLQRVRGDTKRSDDAYQMDYKIVGAIQKLATEYNVLILIVHHTKKGKVDDAIDSITGSFGISGAADGSIVIGKQGDVMRVESWMRDIPAFEFDLIKEDNGPMWKPATPTQELSAPNESTKTQSVLMALHAAACALMIGDIAKRTNVIEKHITTYLGRLMKSDQVTRSSRGFYMAKGLPYRERIKGVIDVLKRCEKVEATTEVKNLYGPSIAPANASYMILYSVAIKEIEAGFVEAKETLKSLQYRELIKYNTDTIWLIGSDWDGERKPEPSPFAFKYPWEQ